MKFVKVVNPLGKPQYVNPDNILRITEHDLETEIMLANGYTLRIKGKPHEVVKSIEEQLNGGRG